MLVTNPYKRFNVFSCQQEAHADFNGRVSPWHVLKEKKCYPEGCLYFLWRCAKFEKGLPCIHKYNYIGKNCKGCTWYMEEKIHIQPECLLNPRQYEQFLKDIEKFDLWLEDHAYKKYAIMGRIQTVKPWYELILDHHLKKTIHKGYLLVIKNGFIGLDQLKDTMYVRISINLMKQYKFLPRMKLEFRGEVREDHGRIIIHRPSQFEILKKGWGRLWTHDKALVAIKTATLLPGQPEHCLNCPWGALIHIKDFGNKPLKKQRQLYCLKGIQEADGCYVYAMRRMRMKKKRSRNRQH